MIMLIRSSALHCGSSFLPKMGIGRWPSLIAVICLPNPPIRSELFHRLSPLPSQNIRFLVILLTTGRYSACSSSLSASSSHCCAGSAQQNPLLTSCQPSTLVQIHTARCTSPFGLLFFSVAFTTCCPPTT